MVKCWAAASGERSWTHEQQCVVLTPPACSFIFHLICVLVRVCRAVNKIRDGLGFYCINNPPVCIVQVIEPVLLSQSRHNIGLWPLASVPHDLNCTCLETINLF